MEIPAAPGMDRRETQSRAPPRRERETESRAPPSRGPRSPCRLGSRQPPFVGCNEIFRRKRRLFVSCLFPLKAPWSERPPLSRVFPSSLPPPRPPLTPPPPPPTITTTSLPSSRSAFTTLVGTAVALYSLCQYQARRKRARECTAPQGRRGT